MNIDEVKNLTSMNTWQPDYIATSAWVGHLPFAYWFTQSFRPRKFVELGTHYGVSFFTICQSVEKLQLPTECHAVDSWEGDPHAGHYDSSVFDQVSAHKKQHYSTFAELHKCYFDEAVNKFEDKSIDLLHIDGFHSYEAVKHDFEKWLPKLSARAVVFFHDTNEFQEGFGVHQFWAELCSEYPWNTHFLHSHGLGVISLEKGKNAPHPIFDKKSTEAEMFLEYFTSVGKNLMLQSTLDQVNRLKSLVSERDRAIAELESELDSTRHKILNYQNSHSWRITAPLRKISGLLRK